MRISRVLLSAVIATYLSCSLAEITDKIGETQQERTDRVCPGIEIYRRITADPLRISAAIIDLATPGISIKTAISSNTVVGVEPLTSMSRRHNAAVAINGDHWGAYGIPSGLTIIDGDIMTSPRYRTAFGVRKDATPVISRWSDSLSWRAKVIAANGRVREITSLNSECQEDWLTLYTDKFGIPAGGDRFKRTTSAVLDESQHVLEVRTDAPAVAVPTGGYVLVGRNTASDWLQENLKPGEKAELDLKTQPAWDNLQQAIGGGPVLLKRGFYWDDDLEGYPKGEDFDPEWKKTQYLKRQGRSIVGISRDKKKLLLITIDGGQPKKSIGVYRQQAAAIAKELGAWDAMLLAGGPWNALAVDSKIINLLEPDPKHPKLAVERPITNALLVLYKAP